MASRASVTKRYSYRQSSLYLRLRPGRSTKMLSKTRPPPVRLLQVCTPSKPTQSRPPRLGVAETARPTEVLVHSPQEADRPRHQAPAERAGMLPELNQFLLPTAGCV